MGNKIHKVATGLSITFYRILKCKQNNNESTNLSVMKLTHVHTYKHELDLYTYFCVHINLHLIYLYTDVFINTIYIIYFPEHNIHIHDFS